ncbi:hypothetical protein [Aquimarina sp. AU119]|uniref:hypothetical protein n=1 Tax=Aquimarina sp. AU119 TaxID=2108528 RepID=UPI00135B255B|nr:hypothetical protein [Aquimarina sp. AU119]
MKKSILFLQKKLKALVIRLRSSSFSFSVSGFGHRSSDPGLPTSDSRPQTSVIGHRSSDTGHQTSDSQPRTSISHRAIALFFTLTFLQTLIPYNQLWANNNGPNAPEAASFEPVDATDMVNLLTGDFSYVLPLLNVPSPEGGYPIALSYHAGIAMDQEASWVGLGWNLNPGAINRTVNGFPDDYRMEGIEEFFYDRGGVESTSSLNINYSSPIGVVSVGLGFSWGTNKSLGGNVNLGLGVAGLGGNLNIGNRGTSVGLGYVSGGMSFGLSATNSGNARTNSSYAADNSTGISIGSNSGVGLSPESAKNNNLGLNFNLSNSGVGIVGSNGSYSKTTNAGTNSSVGIENSISSDDYTVYTSGNNANIGIASPIGVFSVGFGKQKIKWDLNKNEIDYVNGPLYFHKPLENVYRVRCGFSDSTLSYDIKEYPPVFSQQEAQNLLLFAEQDFCAGKNNPEINQRCSCEIVEGVKYFMDVNEFPLDNYHYTDLNKNNIVLPNIDGYNVQAQGISGNLDLRYYENGSLFSLEKDHPLYRRYDIIDGVSQVSGDTRFTFESAPSFYFKNEFASYLGTPKASFNFNTTNTDLLSFHQSSEANGLGRRMTGNYVTHYTNEELKNNINIALQKGYMYSRNQYQISQHQDEAIAAFTVVSTDGKRYHYSLPVYNYVTATRTTGTVKNKEEKDAYFEKLQETPYATHWLLTAVTGPDYIDMNSNGKVDNSDYGYWVEFDYGKWSEAYAWKVPYGKDYIESDDEEGVKTRIEGYKDVYYLDQIKTRTHTAVFSKSLRYDAVGHEFKYNSVDWNNAASAFTERFKIPSQQLLKLDRIILLKNADAITLSKGNENEGSVVSTMFPSPNSVMKSHSYNLWGNVFNTSDISNEVLDKAVKVIDLDYRNSVTSLVQGTPNTVLNGRLTLNDVSFKGKRNKGCIPPYRFDYYNQTTFDLENKNDWGYVDTVPWDWSLKSITTPEGGTIDVTYESDDFHQPALQLGRLFSRELNFSFLTVPSAGNNPIDSPKEKIRIQVGIDSNDSMAEGLRLSDYFDPSRKMFVDMWFSGVRNYPGQGYSRFTIDINEQYADIVEWNPASNYMIIEVLASSPYRNEDFRTAVNPVSAINANGGYGENEKKPRYELVWRADGDGNAYSLVFKVIGNKDVFDQKEGDIRVKKLSVGDGLTNYATQYFYNQEGYNQDPENSSYRSSGIVSFIPNDNNVPIPYASELPAPKVTYEKVSVVNSDNNNRQIGKSEYTFNVLKGKDADAIRFGDLYEIVVEEREQENAFIDGAYGYNILALSNLRETTIHDNLSAIGQLKELKIYNEVDQLISISQSEYFDKNNRPNNQGIEQVSFQSYRETINIDNYFERNNRIWTNYDFNWLIGGSTKITYAPALKRQVNVTNNIKEEVSYDNFDPVSGKVIETSRVLSDQTEIKSVVIPAYKQYSQMGSKVDDLANKNMLAQTTGSLTQIKVGSVWKTVGAGIETWNKDWTYHNQDGTTHTPTSDAEKIWRKHESYIWKGDIDADGAYVGYTGEFDGFQWNGTQTNPKWMKTSTTNLYDHYSMPLESSDINGNSVATKMGDDDTKVIAVANAKYTEMFYSGAEYTVAGSATDFDGEVKTSGSAIEVADAHTGTHIVRVNGGAGFEVTLPADPDRVGEKSKFKMSVWVRKGQESNVSMRVQGTNTPFNTNESVTAGNWTLLNGYIDIPTSQTIVSVQSSGATDMDDFRLHPVSSNMTSYVYNEWDELSYILGANNLATQYEYDDTGRLIRTLSETVDATGIVGGLKPTQETEYHYKNIGCTTDGNEIEPPLNLSLGIQINGLTATITAQPYNGSGNYSYRWAVGNPGESNSNLMFGPWGNSTTINVVDELCNRVYFIAEVRDNVTNQNKSIQTFYLGYCNTGGGEGGDGNTGIQY